VGRPALEVADIFREHGPAWREAQRGHLSLAQLKVMSAIVQCRTAALGGHVLRCEGCGTDQIAYNSCRNRHCPKCQSTAAQRWLDARQADLLPVEYYHVVFTLPAPIADIAYQNKAAIYGLLFRCNCWSSSRKRRRNSRDSTRTGRKNPGLQATQRVPSDESPPPGTIPCTCGWCVSAEPQVCNTSVAPMRAPRCLGSAAMVCSTSAC